MPPDEAVDPVDVDRLIADLSRDARRRRILRTAGLALLPVWAVLLGYIVFGNGRISLGYFNVILQLTNLGFLFAAWMLLNKTAAKRAAEVRDLRVVCPLVDVIGQSHSRDGYGKADVDVASAAICKLLPQIDAANAELLDQTHRGLLYRVLTRKADAALKVAAIEALARIEDGGAVDSLELLLAASGKGAPEPTVREAAERALPVVRASRDRQRQSATLLRPSGSAAPDQATTLVRPASSSDTDSATLLRPTRE